MTLKVETMCKGICKLDEKDEYCIGCGRYVHDICNWVSMGKEKRQEIIESLKDYDKY